MSLYSTGKSLFNTDKTQLMEYVLDRYYVEYKATKLGWQKVRCFNPYAHPGGDKHPSASVNLEYGHYRCFGCDLSGDGYQVLQQLEGWNVKQVNEAFGGVVQDDDEHGAWI